MKKAGWRGLLNRKSSFEISLFFEIYFFVKEKNQIFFNKSKYIIQERTKMQDYYIGENSKEKFSSKIIVIGNTLVGKTSILSRYINNFFAENKEYVTIGLSINTETETNLK